jgi:hypothetical protein
MLLLVLEIQWWNGGGDDTYYYALLQGWSSVQN